MIRLSMTQLYPRYQGFHCSWRRGLCTSKKIYYAWNIIHLLHILMGIFFMVNKLSQKASGTVIKSGLLDQTRVPRFRVGNPLAIISKFWCPRSCMRRIYLSLFTNVFVTLRYAVILYYFFSLGSNRILRNFTAFVYFLESYTDPLDDPNGYRKLETARPTHLWWGGLTVTLYQRWQRNLATSNNFV